MLKPLNSFLTVNVQPLFSVLNLQPLMGAQNLDLLWKEPLGMFFSFLYPYIMVFFSFLYPDIMVASRGKGGPGRGEKEWGELGYYFWGFCFHGFRKK